MAGISYTETEENWQMIRETDRCQLMYDTTRSRLKVISCLKNLLISRVYLSSVANVEGRIERFQWLVTPDVIKGNRMSLTLPLSILDTDGDVSMRRSEGAEDDPSAKYILRVEFEDRTDEKSCVSSRFPGLRANISVTRLANLYQKLMEHFGDKNDSQELGNLLYRNKDQEYFKCIEQGDGIMHPYIKDNNGDQNNPLNGRVKGLFFCATLYDGKLPRTSPFGSRRFQASIQSLLESLGTWTIYFADFYCMEYTSGIHYVTLVLCKRGSKADKFCQKKLYGLPEENPVFVINPKEDGFRICRRKYAWVEIFYTEAINVRDMLSNKGARMTHVDDGEYKRSTDGIPKNILCSKCNLKPREWMPVEDETERTCRLVQH